MKFKSKIGTVFGITFIVFSVMTISSAVFAFVLFSWLLAFIAVAFTLFLILFFIPVFRNTFYQITDDNLAIKTGRHEIIIPYANILSISRGVKSMLMQPALSFARLEIKYKTPQGNTDFVHISPVNESEFLTLLESRI